jgi:predicted GNAT family N-acyltransferase
MLSPLYQQVIDLRERVLLAPLGWTMRDYLAESPGREERCEHYAAVTHTPSGQVVVGTAMLLGPDLVAQFAGPKPHGSAPYRPIDGLKLGKVMQVAVDPQLQGQGIGTSVMVAIEARAFGELALDGLYCHAQTTATGFYEKLGWSVESDLFDEAGIMHRRMEIRNVRVAANPADDPLDDF